jgi:hypothetical protein
VRLPFFIAMKEILELRQVQLSNGCVGVDAAPLIAAAKAAAARRPGQELCHAVKFTVCLDGERHECKSVKALEKVLQAITPGSKCRVFRNAGFGATLDFDID